MTRLYLLLDSPGIIYLFILLLTALVTQSYISMRFKIGIKENEECIYSTLNFCSV